MILILQKNIKLILGSSRFALGQLLEAGGSSVPIQLTAKSASNAKAVSVKTLRLRPRS
jgi:hypothetical protein